MKTKLKNNQTEKNNITEGTNNVPSVVLRKCCACGKVIDRKNLIRILREAKTGKIIINPSNKDFGRSSYLCKSEECLKLAIKKKRFKTLTEAELEILKKLV